MEKSSAAKDDPSHIYGCTLEANQVRLFTLNSSSGHGNDSLSISLTTYDIRHRPPYIALSYCWGDPCKTARVLVERNTLPITDNLYRALPFLQDIQHSESMHRREDVRHWWIDAICINQLDPKERQAQLRMMRQIFGHAVCTVIWLGEHSAGVFSHLDSSEPSEKTEPTGNHSAVEQVTLLKSLQQYQLAQFLQNPYFTRLWMVQENAATANAVFYSGNQRVCRETIVKLCRTAFLANIEEVKAYRTEMSTLTRRALSLLEPKQDQPILHLMSHFRGLECSDARDRIYALISICAEPHRELEGLPGYDVRMPWLYIEAASTLICRSKELSVLSCVQDSGQGKLQNLAHKPPDDEIRLPSWVPDWRLPWRAAVLDPQFANLKAGPSFGACKNEKADPHTSHGSTRLVLQGFNADKVSVTNKPTTNDIQNMTSCMRMTLSNLLGKLSGDSSNARSLHNVYTKTRESYMQALVRTLSADSVKLTSDTLLKPSLKSADHDELSETPRQMKRWVDLNATAATSGVYLPWVGGPGHVATIFNGPKLLDESFDFLSQAISHIKNLLIGRVVFLTQRGYLGLGPGNVQSGDTVYVFLGGDVPFVVRPTGVSSEFSLIGECYLHGFMDGAIISEKAGREEVAEEVVLV